MIRWACFLRVTSLCQPATHILLLLMHQQPNLSLEKSTHTLRTDLLQAFIYPTLSLLIWWSSFLWQPEPINSHLRHWDWAVAVIMAWMTRTSALYAEINKLTKQMCLSIKKNR